jgi:hypothetical protein
MAYIINRFSGQQLVVLEDGTLDTSTSLGLLGRNYTGYGETQNENFLFLLENFANDNPPSRPITGQTWYNTDIGALNVYNGTAWTPVGSAVISDTEPEGFDGGIWYKDITDQLFVYDSGLWKLIGPEAIEGFGMTKVLAEKIRDSNGTEHAALKVVVDGTVLAVCVDDAFTIDDANAIPGFSILQAGTNISTARPVIGSLVGNAESASKLNPGRTINGVYFDGQTDIAITSNTTNTLTRGTYLTGANFNGSTATTWSVDASPNNVIGKIVARDSAGDFSAGTITANLLGNVSGNVTTASGTSTFNIVSANEFIGATLSGNAFTATKLQTARTINTVLFDGSANITVPADGNTLTGTQLAVNIVDSHLTNVGTLSSLDVAGATGITLGGPSTSVAPLRIYLDASTIPTLHSRNSGIRFTILDPTQPSSTAAISMVNAATALALGGLNAPAMIPVNTATTDLGISTAKWNNVHANFFVGTATAAQYADLAEKYVADQEYEPGTVLEFGGEFEVTLAEDGSNRLAGIVSTAPAYLMNSECVGTYVVALALQGRAPCKVRGKISKGDMLMSAGDGYARKAISPQIGTIIGKALADFDGVNGVIEVAVGRV